MNASDGQRPGRATVIGVGNAYRRDDAAGLKVAQQVAAQDWPPERVHVQTASGEGVALMDAWQGAERVVIVDAVQSGGAPGTIYRFEAHQMAIPTRFFNYSTHAFSVAEAIELARALGQLPPRLIVYGIEGQDYAAGEGLSPTVAQAVSAVAEQVRAELADDA